MKYSCQNCNTCCISTSSQVSYCGTPTECNPPSLPYGEAVGLTLLTITLLCAGLVFLYFAFKDRQLGQTQAKEGQIINEQIKKKAQTAVVEKNVDKRRNTKSYKENGQLSLNSKISKKTKSKTSMPKSTTEKQTRTQTQRGLR